jgi:hypothetical protein
MTSVCVYLWQTTRAVTFACYSLWRHLIVIAVENNRTSLSSEQAASSLVTEPVVDSTANTESALPQEDTKAPGSSTRVRHYRSAAPTTKPKDSTKTTDAPKFKAAKTRIFSASEDMAVSTETTWSTEQTAVWAFGRALASMFEDEYAGFLILDHAERLLSLSPSKETPEPNNFLSQLMSLPRVAGLNLTVIVVTNSLLLEHSRKYYSSEVCDISTLLS